MLEFIKAVGEVIIASVNGVVGCVADAVVAVVKGFIAGGVPMTKVALRETAIDAVNRQCNLAQEYLTQTEIVMRPFAMLCKPGTPMYVALVRNMEVARNKVIIECQREYLVAVVLDMALESKASKGLRDAAWEQLVRFSTCEHVALRPDYEDVVQESIRRGIASLLLRE